MTSARSQAAGFGRRSRCTPGRSERAGYLAALVLGGAALALMPASSCGTRAVGVEDCRDLEYARCEAAAQCGDITDVDACKRFYRDHCAHRLPLSDEPADRDVEACRLAMVAAGACAEREGASVDATSCDDPDLVPGSDPRIATACDVVRFPERVPACGFLTETDGGAGGASGEPPGESGTAGVAGASGAPTSAAGTSAAGMTSAAGAAGSGG